MKSKHLFSQNVFVEYLERGAVGIFWQSDEYIIIYQLWNVNST